MAEVLVNSGQAEEGAAVVSPVLTGAFYPNIDRPPSGGLRIVYPWGSSTGIRNLTENMSQPPDEGRPDMLGAIIAASRPADTYNYYFEGLVGPAGPQGPPGTRGVIGDPGTAVSAPSTFDNIDYPIPYSGWEGAFSDKGGGKVGWTSFKIKYQGASYTIAADAVGTTNTYIYYDPNTSTTVLQSTNTLTTATGTEKWVVCENNGGTPTQYNFMKGLIAGLVQAGGVVASMISVTDLAAINAALGSVTSGSITLSLGGNTRLRIDSSGLYTSEDAGSTWTAVIKNTSGTVEMLADILKAKEIVTANLDDNAVTVPVNSSSAGTSSVTSIPTTKVTASITVTGQPVLLTVGADFRPVVSTGLCVITLTRYESDGPSETTVRTFTRYIATGTTQSVYGVVVDTPAADSYEYRLKVSRSGANCNASNYEINAIELKK